MEQKSKVIFVPHALYSKLSHIKCDLKFFLSLQRHSIMKRGSDFMLTTKSRRQGNSVVLTLPTDNGKKPKVDQEYIVMYSDDGTITLVPKIQDPFSEGPEGEYYEKDEWHDLAPEGRELF
ncbi:hypothetical protein HMPREF9505_01697 [Enterococcus faecalis TX0109]|nr:hypothetical protein HMPREF9505_01697 [Enterococcus faecalis TX0109]EFU07578.1 hypothetical protein HMPREF9516_02801 [Enterococcus faecalis TX1302]EPI00621.1 toxin-antitoxin system, antitoxin component, AbrB domain protein [Enterococcus faecalis 20-SD-BW-08]